MYGQKNYNEILGTSGYRINQIGCFLTSFAELSKRFGDDINPLALNRAFTDRGIYLNGGDLYWSAITRFNPNIVVESTGNGVPPHSNAIVKFTGVGNAWGTHFCLVADASKGLIIDAWDGVIKHWSVYGGPKQFATYRDLTPANNPAPIVPVATGGDFVKVQPGWGLSHIAQAAGYGDSGTPARWADIALLNGSTNWQNFNAGLKAGQSVRVRAAAPAPAAPVTGFAVGDVVTVTNPVDTKGTRLATSGNYSVVEINNGSVVIGRNGAITARIAPGNIAKVTAPAAPQPAPTPAPAPQPETVDIVVQPGWGITYVLKAAGYSKEQWDNEAEWDRVAALNGSATRLKLKPNQVVKVYRQPLPIAQPIPAAPAAAPAPVEAPQAVAPVTEAPKPVLEEKADGSVDIPVNVVPKDPKAYQNTLEKEEKVYIASTSKTIHDMDGLHMDLQLVAGQKVTSGGRFDKDGEEFIISKKHLELGQWYGIPVDYLGAGKDPNAYVGPLVNDDSNIDDLLDMDLVLEMKEAIGNLSGREKLINFLGKIYDAVLKLNVFRKKDKN